MPTFIGLFNWTDEGIRTARESVERAGAGRQLAESMGGSIREIYWTLGPFDLVAVADFPDEETAAAFGVALAQQGKVRSTTLRAFSQEEIGGVLGKLG